MKKSNILVACIVLALCFVYSGCSGVGGKGTESSASYLVTGKISLDGAAPVLNADELSSRTAVSDMQNPNFVSSDLSFLIAEDGNQSYTPLENVTFNVNTMTYSFICNKTGQYNILCYLWNQSYSGETSVTIGSDATRSYTADNLIIYPASRGTSISGKVCLEITDETGWVKSVTYKGTIIKKNPTSGDSNSFETGNTVSFNDGKAIIQLENVSPYTYEVTFTFNDEYGNDIYKCKEAVVVLSGFTTNTWYGAGAHLKNNSNGKTEFVITEDLINKFGTDVIEASQMAFYKYDYWASENYEYTYYLSDNVLTTLPGDFDIGLKDNSSFLPKFCYDRHGQIYLFSSDASGKKLSTKQNQYSITITDPVYAISIDRESNNLFLYCYKTGDNDTIARLYACETGYINHINTANTKYAILAFDDFENVVGSQIKYPKAFAVYNDVIYIPFIKTVSGAASLILVKKALTTEDYDDTLQASKVNITTSDLTTYNLFSGLPENCKPTITDIIYQDGNLYILVNDVSINKYWTDSLGSRSRGAVIRVNLFTNKMDVLGWTDEELDTSTAGTYCYTNYSNSIIYSNSEHTERFIIDGTKRLRFENGDEIPISSQYPELYVPDGGKNLSSTAFYGAQKFIAIKPKKLVISDDGVAFYTNDDGALAFRNVNRVVFVDLETFAITSCSEVPVSYAGGVNSDFSGDFIQDIREQNFLTDDISDFYYGSDDFDESLYKSNGGNITSNDLNQLYLYIYREDN